MGFKLDKDFISRLQAEASLQAKLEEKRILPSKLDGLIGLIAQHNFAFLLAVSLLTALLWQLLIS